MPCHQDRDMDEVSSLKFRGMGAMHSLFPRNVRNMLFTCSLAMHSLFHKVPLNQSSLPHFITRATLSLY